MIPPIDPSAANHWTPHRQHARTERPAPGKRVSRPHETLHEELTLWQVLLEPEPTAIAEKSGFAAAYEAAERQASYRISFYQAHQPEHDEPERGNWWDTRA